MKKHPSIPRVCLAATLTLSLLATPGLSFAWGQDAHRLVATLAGGRLSPAARAEVQRLLALEPGATLESVSTWADEHRSPATGKWHYVNLPRDADCHFEAERDCPTGQCAVGAIERQAAVLASSKSDEERLKALKYVVHLVGDIHQPLHAGYADDKGGNKYQLHAFGRGTNLHSLWDSGLVNHRAGGLDQLQADATRVPAPKDAQSKPVQWVEQSCRLVAADGFYPSGHKINEAYSQRWDAVLVQQIGLAGQRLAGVLNASLGKRAQD